MPHTEEEAYYFALNRQFRKGKAEQKIIVARESHGLNLTDRQHYFIAKLEAALQYTHDVCKDLENESILLEAVQGVIVAGAAYGVSRLASRLIPQKELGDVITCAATSLAIIYSAKNIVDKVQAKKQASKFTKFLSCDTTKRNEEKETKAGAKETFSAEFSTILACELYLDFRPAIEMLAKSSKGIDVLIHFFVKRIQELISQIPEATLSKLTLEGKLDHIKKDLATGKIEKQNLMLRECKGEDLTWNLQGLLTRSPIIIWKQLDEDVYRSEVYVCKDDTKNRRILGLTFDSSKNADDSYKYPCTIKFCREEAGRSPGHTRSSERYFAIPVSTWKKSIGDFSSQIDKYYDELISFYKVMRKAHKNPTNLGIFQNTIENFCQLCQLLNNMHCSSNLEWQQKFIEMEQLRNIFTNVLERLYQLNKANFKAGLAKKWGECEKNYRQLCESFTNEEQVKQIQEIAGRTQIFFYDRLNSVVMSVPTPEQQRKRLNFNDPKECSSLQDQILLDALKHRMS